MSTSSPPSSINNNEEPVLKKDSLVGRLESPMEVHISSPPTSLYYHQSNNTSVSPRVPRKRIPCVQDDLEEDDFNDDHKPILSSPSIMITPNSPMSSRNPNCFVSSLSPSDEDYNDQDDSHKYRIMKDSSSNWIQMDNFIDKPDTMNKVATQKLKPKKEYEDTKIDVSLYTTKKNVAQGMLDIALLSANCSQLKYLLYHYERDVPLSNSSSSSAASPSTITGRFGNTSLDFYFTTNLICISVSIFLQVIVGILLILNSRHNVYIHRYQRVADSYSNWILLAIFIVTVVNIFLSVFISAR